MFTKNGWKLPSIKMLGVCLVALCMRGSNAHAALCIRRHNLAACVVA